MKKLYTSTLMLLMFALCILNFSACQEFNIDSQPEGPLNIQIDAQDTYTALATSPSNIVFNVSSNTPWTITSDQQWCKVTPAMSAASSLVSEIVVTLENNIGKQARKATLTIEADGVEGTKVITIEQASKEDLVVIPYDELVPTEGGDITFTIASNKAWEIIPSTAFVSNIDKTSGTGNENATIETITVKIPANAGARREGQITVKTAFKEETFTITQNGVVIEQEEPSESGTIDFGWNVSERTIKVRANKAWKVKVPKEYADWISAEALNDAELKITLKPSNKVVTRKGQVLLSTVEVIPGFEGIPFEITQAPQFYFSGSDVNRIIDEATGNVKMMSAAGNNINSNFAFKKGHLTIEFEEVNFTGASRLYFNMWPDAGNTNFNFGFTGSAVLGCGGSGFAWEQQSFALTDAELKAVRKIEFFVEDDPEHVNMLRIRLAINGADKAILKNKSNCYVDDPGNNPGQKVYLQITDAKEGEYYTIKSITHEPAE